MLGRLYAEVVKSVVITTVMILIALPFGVRIESGVLGYLVLVVHDRACGRWCSAGSCS